MSKTLRGLAVAFALLGCATAWAAPPAEFQDEQALSAAELNQRFGFIYALLGPAEQLEAQPAPDATILARLEALEEARDNLVQQNAALATRVQQLEAQLGLNGQQVPEGAVVSELQRVATGLDVVQAQLGFNGDQPPQTSVAARLDDALGRLEATEGVANGAGAAAGANGVRLDSMTDAVIEGAQSYTIGGMGARFPDFPAAFEFLSTRRLAPDATVTLVLNTTPFLVPNALDFGHPQGQQISIHGRGIEHSTLQCTTRAACLRVTNSNLGGIRDIRFLTATADKAIELKNGSLELERVEFEGFNTAVTSQQGRLTADQVTVVNPTSYGFFLDRSTADIRNTTTTGEPGNPGPLDNLGGTALMAVASSVFLGTAEDTFVGTHLEVGIAAQLGSVVWGGDVGLGVVRTGFKPTTGAVIATGEALVENCRSGVRAENGGLADLSRIEVRVAAAECAVARYGSKLYLADANLLLCRQNGVVAGFDSLARVDRARVGEVTGRAFVGTYDATVFGENGVEITSEDDPSCDAMPDPPGAEDPSAVCQVNP